MQWVVEPTALDWVHDRLDDFFAGRVGSLIPSGFEAYARILPPPQHDPCDGTGGGEQTYRWRAVAAWSATTLGPSSTFTDIATRPDPHSPDGRCGLVERWPGGVHQGPPQPKVARELVEVLRADPATAGDQGCWFAVREGYGWVWGGILVMSTDPAQHGVKPSPEDLVVPGHVRDGPRAWRPHRSYVLYTGSIDDALAIADSPSRWSYDDVPDLWWPADRSWFVGSDTDLTCTYLGASHATVQRLLGDPRLETQLVSRDDLLA